MDQGNRASFFVHAPNEFSRREHAHMPAPAQNPALDFFQAAELKLKGGRAVSCFTKPL